MKVNHIHQIVSLRLAGVVQRDTGSLWAVARAVGGPWEVEGLSFLRVHAGRVQTKRPDVQGREVTPTKQTKGAVLAHLSGAKPHQPIPGPPGKRVDQTNRRRGVDVRPIIPFLDAKASVRC